MKSKIEKYLKYVAAAVFVATLAINIAITMDDPFVLLSNAMAETTTTTTTTTTTDPEPNSFDPQPADCPPGETGTLCVFCSEDPNDCYCAGNIACH